MTIITLMIGIIGAMIARKLKIPSGAMVGALFIVAFFNVSTGLASMPPEVKIFTQIIAGLFIGSTVKRKDVIALKSMVFPAVSTVLVMICFSMSIGFVIFKITPFNLVTAMLASAPGGIVDMSLVAYDMGAEMSAVSMLQLVRLVSVIGFFPSLVSHFVKKKTVEEPIITKEQISTSIACECPPTIPEAPKSASHKYKNMLTTACVSIICGLIGSYLKVPAGALVFSMMGVAIKNIIFNNVYMPIKVKLFAQICAGTLIGVNVTLASIINLKSAIIPAFILIIGFTLMTIATSLVLHKTSKLDLVTCFFACVPGGAADICLLSSDYGADTAKIVVIQVLRLVCVISFYPIVISFLSTLT